MQNQKILTKIILSLVVVTLSTLLCFNFVLAQTHEADKYSGRVTLEDPLGIGTADNNINLFIGRIIGNILGVVGSLALLMFIIGGIMWMTSAGNENRVKKGKDILTWAALGLVIIFTSYAILKFVFDVLLNRT